MTEKFSLFILALFAFTLFLGEALAEEHTTQALQHANEAVQFAGDSNSVGKHASEALKHLEMAKAGSPENAKKLEKSKEDLKSAVNNASHFNTDSATKDAADAKSRLETIGK